MKQESLIERFFEGLLTEAEQDEFDHLFSKDPEFRREVEFQKGLKEIISHHERSKLKKQLRSIENGQRTPVKRQWWIAAAVTLLVLLSGIWYSQNQKQEPETLFATYFEPYRNVILPIERNGETIDPKARAFYAYEQGNYEEALKAFTGLAPEDKDPAVIFFIANTHLALNQSDLAIELLEANLNKIDSLQDRHLWYLAMAYLNKGDQNNAISQLEALLDLSGDSFKQKEARLILEELE